MRRTAGAHDGRRSLSRPPLQAVCPAGCKHPQPPLSRGFDGPRPRHDSAVGERPRPTWRPPEAHRVAVALRPAACLAVEAAGLHQREKGAYSALVEDQRTAASFESRTACAVRPTSRRPIRDMSFVSSQLRTPVRAYDPRSGDAMRPHRRRDLIPQGNHARRGQGPPHPPDAAMTTTTPRSEPVHLSTWWCFCPDATGQRALGSRSNADACP